MLNLILFFSAFLFMEFVAWFTHKYVMHGFLWNWHKDHHIKDRMKNIELENSGFEKNDLFFLVYAIPAMVLIVSGFYFNIDAFKFLGFGITLYGFTYFLVHDVLIHQRIKIPALTPRGNTYFNALVKAHFAHHNSRNKHDFQSFGLLIFPNLRNRK